jgi:SH3-like domain-containing protein
VEITAEYENWRRIRDWDGAEGWVYHSLLSGKRTAFVAKSKTASAPAALRESADPESPLKAMLEPGVLGAVKRCSGRWCRFLGNGFDGWIEQDRLWGSIRTKRWRTSHQGSTQAGSLYPPAPHPSVSCADVGRSKAALSALRHGQFRR